MKVERKVKGSVEYKNIQPEDFGVYFAKGWRESKANIAVENKEESFFAKKGKKSF